MAASIARIQFSLNLLHNLILIFIVILKYLNCDIVSTEGKSDDVKERFYEQIEQVFDKFPNYHMKKISRRFQCQSQQRRQFQTNNWE
jgi:hypothetical protein